MSRGSKSPEDELSPNSKTQKWQAAIQTAGRLLLVLIGVLQVAALVQSDSPTDTFLHGVFLLVLIVVGTRKPKRHKNLHRRG